MPEPFGFLNINKPLGVTSHDVVARVRRVVGTRRVGHAGTLDPLADGVLVVCVGAATRLSEYVMAHEKTYTARLRLGQTTATYDAEGDVLTEADTAHLTQADVLAVLPGFTGVLQQVPPAYSAVKQGGRKLYELARAGEAIDAPARAVTIYRLTLDEWAPPFCTLTVTCGSGTYIRSLAHDIGAALGVGAHLVGLTRTHSGQFDVADAVTLDALAAMADWRARLISPTRALADWPTLTLTDAQLAATRNGQPLAATPDEDGALALGLTEAGELAAVLRAAHGRWHPHKVFLTGGAADAPADP